MAKATAPVPTPTGRNLWQLPTFLLGIASLVGVWYARPYLRPSPAQRYERDLVQLRQQLDKPGADIQAIQALLRRIEAGPMPAHLAAQTGFLRGSAHVALAEAAEGKEAEDLWKTAREELEAVTPSEVPLTDQQRLFFRLGKTWAHTDSDPMKVIEMLGRSLQAGDDPAEGYRLLASQYLKLKPADPKRARDALREYLSRALPRTDARVLNGARLKLGELYTQLGEIDDARKVLERIGPDAPPDVYVLARSQLARGYQAEEDWPQAIRNYEQARDAAGLTPAQKGPVLYHLATCYQKVNRRTDAVAALEQARQGSGPEAQAAAIRLAELQIRDAKQRDAAAKALEAALPEGTTPDGYSNEFLPLNEARGVFEEAAGVYRVGGEFELAVRVVRAYARIAEPGRDKELLAEANEAWAAALAQQAQRDETERPRLEEAAHKRFREAAIELEELLEARAQGERAPLAKHAAELWVKAGDRERAARVLKDAGVKADLPTAPEDGLIAKAKAALQVGDRTQAMQALEKAASDPGPNQAQARLLLAEMLLPGNDADQARAIGLLEANLTPEVEKDPKLHEGSVYLLGFSLYQRRDWRKAELRFNQALGFYPESARAVKARFHLGRSYWYLAAQEAKRIQELDQKLANAAAPEPEKARLKAQKAANEKQYREALLKAAGPFQQVETELLKRKESNPLGPEETQLLRQASFAAGEVAFYLGEYEECIDRYQKLQERYRNRIDYLMASSQLWQCYYYLKDAARARGLQAKMREAFGAMPQTEFDGTAESRKRDFWERWLQQAEQTPIEATQ